MRKKIPYLINFKSFLNGLSFRWKSTKPIKLILVFLILLFTLIGCSKEVELKTTNIDYIKIPDRITIPSGSKSSKYSNGKTFTKDYTFSINDKELIEKIFSQMKNYSNIGLASKEERPKPDFFCEIYTLKLGYEGIILDYWKTKKDIEASYDKINKNPSNTISSQELQEKLRDKRNAYIKSQMKKIEKQINLNLYNGYIDSMTILSNGYIIIPKYDDENGTLNEKVIVTTISKDLMNQVIDLIHEYKIREDIRFREEIKKNRETS